MNAVTQRGPPAPAGQSMVRETGRGPAVLCLHANASSSSQWQALGAELGSRYRVLAPDCYDAGQSPAWPDARRISLHDEAQLLEPLIERQDGAATLVGHSYGGALALIVALRTPARVRALALYEPTLFSLVDALSPAPNAVDGIRRAVALAGHALDAGDREGAARIFIDFWTGEGAWQATPEHRKGSIRRAIVNVRRWGHALIGEPAPLRALAGLKVPVLLLRGEHSPASATSVVDALHALLPRATVVTLPGLGHMGPLTHPAQFNARVAAFLDDLHWRDAGTRRHAPVSSRVSA